MNKTIINHLICLINNSLKLKKKFGNISFSNETFFFLYILYLENYLEYLFIKEDKIFFKIKYSKGYPIIKNIMFFSKKGQKKVISFKNFWSAFNYFHKQTVFLTTKKLITDSIIKKCRIGGQALIIINI